MVPELSADNAIDWLRRHNLPTENVTFTELGGGVSNKVVLAEGRGFRAVLKQSLAQLRTELEWRSDRARIFREAAALRFMHGKTTGARIPQLLFEDQETFTIGMEAAPAGAEMWKTLLFRGEHDRSLAKSAGVMLGSIVARSWHDAEAGQLFGDQTVFDQLRIDPSYRFTARRRPDAAACIHRLIERSAARRASLVHGDWSPKNLLVSNGQLWAIDWEVIHYGDPSFDVGFLLNHLLLKSIAMPQHRSALSSLAQAFLEGLASQLPAAADWIILGALEHVPALLLARVEGKSPAEYFDAAMRLRASALATDLMSRPATSPEELFAR